MNWSASDIGSISVGLGKTLHGLFNLAVLSLTHGVPQILYYALRGRVVRITYIERYTPRTKQLLVSQSEGPFHSEQRCESSLDEKGQDI